MFKSAQNQIQPRIAEGGVLVAGPPCSLMVSACQSVHRRRPWRLEGDTGNWKIRLSNLIWDNFVPLTDDTGVVVRVVWLRDVQGLIFFEFD